MNVTQENVDKNVNYNNMILISEVRDVRIKLKHQTFLRIL